MADLSVAQQAIEQALSEAGPDSHVECQWCGLSSNDVGSDRVVEHALFDHSARSGITVVRQAELLSGYELALAAGLPALTRHEEAWREEQREKGLRYSGNRVE